MSKKSEFELMGIFVCVDQARVSYFRLAIRMRCRSAVIIV